MTPPVAIPAPFAALATYRQFVTFRLVPSRKAGKMDKIPCDATGQPCDAHDPGAWMDYSTAATLAPLANVGHGCGVGFVFTDADPFWFLDLDGARDAAGRWSARSIELGQMLPGVAFEVSTSGTGCHFIGSGAVPDHSCKNVLEGLEFYHSRRFVALSFRDCQGDASVDGTAGVAAIVAQYFPPNEYHADLTGWRAEPVPEWSGYLDDDKLLAAAMKSTSTSGSFGGAPVMFRDLWEGNAERLAARWPADAGSANAWDRSHADGALATHLSFWTGRNHQRILELMWQCEAMRREKWERSDYLERTILRAAAANARIHQREVKAPPPPPPAAVVEAQAQTAFSNGWSGQADKSDHLYIETVLVGVLGGVLRYDEFTDRIVKPDGTALDDSYEAILYLRCRAVAGLPFNKELFRDVIRAQSALHRFNPARDTLDALEGQWDGVPRVERWLIDFAGVDDTPFNRTVGSIFLRAAVRRIRQPGAKHDELMVLESPQGWDKSSLLRALCPREEWFTDSVHIGMSSKEFLEQCQGKMIVEFPELSSMEGKEIEAVKHILAVQSDRARPAYARYAIEVGRQWIGAATINPNGHGYLRDPTGNRRFYPVRMSRPADVAALRIVRDQLWAEAAALDRVMPSTRLPRELWAVAADLQSERMVSDPTYEKLAEMLDGLTGRILSETLWDAMRVGVNERHRLAKLRGNAMTRLGWKHERARIDGQLRYVYVKGDTYPERARNIEWAPVEQRLVQAPPTLSVV